MGVPGGPVICDGLGLLLGESSRLERLPFRRDADGDSSVYEPRIVFSGEFIGDA